MQPRLSPGAAGTHRGWGCPTLFSSQITSPRQRYLLTEFVPPQPVPKAGTASQGDRASLCPHTPVPAGDDEQSSLSSWPGCAHGKAHTLLESSRFFILAQNSSRDDYLKDESPNTIAKTHP